MSYIIVANVLTKTEFCVNQFRFELRKYRLKKISVSNKIRGLISYKHLLIIEVSVNGIYTQKVRTDESLPLVTPQLWFKSTTTIII